jgi:hypothetical protein
LGAATIDVSYDPSVISPVSCAKDPAGLFDMVLWGAKTSSVSETLTW